MLRTGKSAKYAARFVQAVGKIIFLRQNDSCGLCDSALVLGDPIRKSGSTSELFVEEWGAGSYIYVYSVKYLLTFPAFNMSSFKMGSVPGRLVDRDDLDYAFAALSSAHLCVYAVDCTR